MRMRTWDSFPKPNFVKKNPLRDIPLFGKFIPKIINFSDLGVVSPHFESDSGEIWLEGTDLGYPPPRLI